MYRKRLWSIETLWEQMMAGIPDTTESILPSVNYINDFDFSTSPNIVHSDDYGQYSGLLYSQYIKRGSKTIFLCDNHNKMIEPFTHYYHWGGSFCVVHIDAHRDNAQYAGIKPLCPLALGDTDVAIKETRISDFFDYLSETNMIQKIYRYCDSVSIQERTLPKTRFILSLDIDIFGEEGAFVGDAEKIACIAKAWQQADMVCIAMSPGFIDQDFAKNIIKILTKPHS